MADPSHASVPFKFPRTPHLLNLGSATDDDLILDHSEAERWLARSVVIEEKVDGTNLGISFPLGASGPVAVQHRGRWVAAGGESQYSKLPGWIDQHKAELWNLLGQRYVLYGEWMAARHSVYYTTLPDWLLVYDIYDKEQSFFLASAERDRFLAGSSLHVVPSVCPAPGIRLQSVQALVELLNGLNSPLGVAGPAQLAVEGVYLRAEENGRLVARAKVVHPSFKQAIADAGAHWQSRSMQPNIVRPDLWWRADSNDSDHDAQQRPEREADRAANLTDGVRDVPARAPDGSEAATSVDVAGGDSSKESSDEGTALELAWGTRIVAACGCVWAEGPAVDAVAEAVISATPLAVDSVARANRVQRDGPGHHITLVTPPEADELRMQRGMSLAAVLKAVRRCMRVPGARQWLPLGAGSACEAEGTPEAAKAVFCVVAWPAAHAVRAHLGLARVQDFHITLGFSPRDVHAKSKGINALMQPFKPTTAGTTQLAIQHLVQALHQASPSAEVHDSQRMTACLLLQLEAHRLMSAPSTAPTDQLLVPPAQTTTSTSDAADPAAVTGRRPLSAISLLRAPAGFNVFQPQSSEALQCMSVMALDLASAHGNVQGAAVGAMPSMQAACLLAAAHVLHARLLGRMNETAEAHQVARKALGVLAPYVQEQTGAAALQHAGGDHETARATAACAAAAHAICGKAAWQEQDWEAVCASFSAALVLREAVVSVQRDNTTAGSTVLDLVCSVLLSLADPDAAKKGHAAAAKKMHGAAVDNATAETVSPASEQLSISANNPRERLTVDVCERAGEAPVSVTLMRNTSWLVPGQVLASSTPRHREDIIALAHALQVRLVITLTEETPLLAEWFQGLPIRNRFIPVQNYEPPSVQQADAALHEMEQTLQAAAASGQAAGVLVHCGGGKGRAGTVLACWMVKHGVEPWQPAAVGDAPRPPVMSAEGAVGLLRAMRPGSIETTQQQRFVTTYAKELWRRHDEAVRRWEATQQHHDDEEDHAQEQRKASAESDRPSGSGSGGSSGGGSSKMTCGTTHSAAPSSGHAASITHSGDASSHPGGRTACDDSNAKLPGGYPSTPHLPFSPTIAADDVCLPEAACSELCGPEAREVVVTEKVDGGNCCIHGEVVYARTHSHPATHNSFSPIKALAATLTASGLLPSHLALFGENMTAVHSIAYKSIPSHFLLFAVWDCNLQAWLSWDEVEQLADQLGLHTVPVLHRRTYASMEAMATHLTSLLQQPSALDHASPREGFVVRTAGCIPASDFDRNVAKYVRKGHVQTDDAWRRTWQRANVVMQAPSATCASHTHSAAASSSESQGAAADAGAGTSADPPDVMVVRDGASGASGASQTRPARPAQRGRHAASAARGTGKPGRSAAKLPKLVMLVGLPGSGKSTFAKALAQSDPRWVHVCQDEAGNRSAAEAQFGHAMLRGPDHCRHVILDRCNVEAADRRTWLDLGLVGKRDKGIVAVFFNIPADTCKQRVMARTDHPTIPFGRGSRIVQSFADKLQAPALSEGFERVHLVASVEDANELLRAWGASPAAPS